MRSQDPTLLFHPLHNYGRCFSFTGPRVRLMSYKTPILAVEEGETDM